MFFDARIKEWKGPVMIQYLNRTYSFEIRPRTRDVLNTIANDRKIVFIHGKVIKINKHKNVHLFYLQYYVEISCDIF